MSGTESKPRIRIPAGSSAYTADGFTNFQASLGYGTSNIASGGSYGFHPLSRNRNQLDWMYRGSWLAKQMVDAPADDMTRAGTAIDSDLQPDIIDQMGQYWNRLQLWARLNSALKWSRLYGGALAVIMIDGQKTSEPLRLNTVGKNQFKGLLVLDRWMLYPHNENPVVDLGVDYALPQYYDVVADAKAIPNMRIHHSRVIRFDGIELPYWQKVQENNWGLSILEPVFDRMIAFDSATQGAAQLVYKAHLRILKIDGLREIISMGGPSYQALLAFIQNMRLMQTNEGLTILDKEDDFQANAYGFGGLADMLVQFGQQLSGGSQIPLTRLFGQSPAGLNSTGESDMRNYYDSINAQQEARLRLPVMLLYELVYRSLYGEPLPNGFGFSFNPLWQMTNPEKADIASKVTTLVDQAMAGGLISQKTGLKELRQSSRLTGIWSNITDEDIEAADETIPNPAEAGMGMENGLEPGPDETELDPAGSDTQLGTHEAGAPADTLRHFVARSKEPRAEEDDSASLAPADVLKQLVDSRRERTPAEKLKEFVGSKDRMPFLEMYGLPIVIETAKGHQRSGGGWKTTLAADYGYIRGTGSGEGDREQMDCFVGPDTNSRKVWVLEQLHPGSQEFDEHKVLLGFPDQDTAVAAYKNSYDDHGEGRIGEVREMSVSDFKAWVRSWKYGSGMNGNSFHG